MIKQYVVNVGTFLGDKNVSDVLINQMPIVVRKDETKTGDIMIYAMNETALNKQFLGANNLFELSERALNRNYKEVQELLDKGAF